MWNVSLINAYMCICERYAITLTSFLILIGGACATSKSADLLISIESVDSVSQAQYVLVNITLTNVCDSNIILYNYMDKIQYAMDGILFFDIVCDGHDSLISDRIGPIPKYPFATDTMILVPSEIYTETVNLTSYYADPSVEDETMEDSTSMMGLRKWNPGTYTVQCRYHYPHQPSFTGGRDLWRGFAVSNRIIIQVNDDE